MKPEVGEWYRNVEEDERFQVLEVDGSNITVEYDIGEMEEIDLDDWEAEFENGILEKAEPPEDEEEDEDDEDEERDDDPAPPDDDSDYQGGF